MTRSLAPSLRNELLETIEDENQKGKSDTEIARKLGRPRRTVSKYRRLLGLPGNANDARAKTVRKSTRRQVRRDGLSQLGDYRIMADRTFVVQSGWPIDLVRREVEILDLLASAGEKTRRQLCLEIGLPWNVNTSLKNHTRPGGSYLAHLVRRGLVVRHRRGTKRIYELAPGARKRRDD